LPTFADANVDADLVALLARRGITDPFPIQSAALPDALAGRDVCGRAPTGSGKTLAFGLALVQRSRRGRPGRPTALVLVPTRELAAQVVAELEPLAALRKVRVAPVYGGTSYGAQHKALSRGPAIIVATPGRLEDLVARSAIELGDVSVVVLDEADRMADMGFLPAVKRLLDATKPDRQTLLFSATLDGDVDVLIKRYQKNPTRHEIAEADTGDVDHQFLKVERAARVAVTAGLVQEHGSAIVFCRTRHGADRVARQLAASGIGAATIHGSRSQPQRERALAAFRAGRVQALVATDVAARGIHIDDVACVVHFDPAADDKDYTHRSGRTGRAGATGTVVTLMDTQPAAVAPRTKNRRPAQQRSRTRRWA
jgi:superfamily II DNA/RNA helicase